MFIRFRGGGVGHKATSTRTSIFQIDNPETVAASINDVAMMVDYDVTDDEDAQIAEEEDYGYSFESDEEECEDEEVDDMGAEDGEEPWDMDDLVAEGYGEL